VIIATVRFGPAAAFPAAGAAAAAEESVAAFPPEDEQAVRASAAAESATTAPTARLERIMIGYLSNITATSRRCPGMRGGTCLAGTGSDVPTTALWRVRLPWSRPGDPVCNVLELDL
jgi:hypothetical protein